LRISPETGSSGENSQSLIDATAGEIDSKVRIDREMIIKTNSFIFLQKSVDACMELLLLN
jgi:hypothetical protein